MRVLLPPLNLHNITQPLSWLFMLSTSSLWAASWIAKSCLKLLIIINWSLQVELYAIQKACWWCCSITKLRLTLCDPMDCIACQAPLSMGFARQEYWSGLLLPHPGDLPTQESNPCLLLAGGFFTTEPPGKPTESTGLAKKFVWVFR